MKYYTVAPSKDHRLDLWVNMARTISVMTFGDEGIPVALTPAEARRLADVLRSMALECEGARDE